MMTNKLFALLVALLLLSTVVFAWEGYDYENSTYIEIESGNLVRDGESIEFYDYDDGDYHNADVESIERYGSSVELELYDYDSGEYRTFEMED